MNVHSLEFSLWPGFKVGSPGSWHYLGSLPSQGCINLNLPTWGLGSTWAVWFQKFPGWLFFSVFLPQVRSKVVIKNTIAASKGGCRTFGGHCQMELLSSSVLIFLRMYIVSLLPRASLPPPPGYDKLPDLGTANIKADKAGSKHGSSQDPLLMGVTRSTMISPNQQ